MFWTSISCVPKGILKKIWKKSFQYLWLGNHNSNGIPLVKWLTIVMPKNLGGWGLKNIYLFSQSLAARSLWRLTHNFSLWGRVMRSKYLVGKSMEEWYRDPKSLQKMAPSSGRPRLGLSLLLVIGQCGRWEMVGNKSWGRSLARINMDGFCLSANMVQALHNAKFSPSLTQKLNPLKNGVAEDGNRKRL
jgi:hypothetical protein